MAVIVKDMEMPECCAGCEFAKVWDNGHFLCSRKPQELPIPAWIGRPWFCPLVDAEQIDQIGG